MFVFVAIRLVMLLMVLRWARCPAESSMGGLDGLGLVGGAELLMRLAPFFRVMTGVWRLW